MISSDLDQLVRLRSLIDPGQWGIVDLATLAATLLGEDAGSGRVTSDRTIRYYASRRVIASAIGRGASARWDYRHLVELLAARIAVREGDSLDGIAARRSTMGLPELEQWVASHLAPPQQVEKPVSMPQHEARLRFIVAEGVELNIRGSHPIAADPVRIGALIATLAREASATTEETE